MIKVYDCSNMGRRPKHRGYGGPKENDIIRYLKEYSGMYDCSFVDALKDAQVVITNDVFPKKVLDSGLPLVKRADGIYFQNKFKNRNELLNEAISQANHVIFISEFSKDSYFALYQNPIKYYSVAVNRADPNIFKPMEHKLFTNSFAACATDWTREEKRFKTLIDLIHVDPEIKITLIGKHDGYLPGNFSKVKYVDNPKSMSIFLRSCDGFLNFSYRDACPKTVAQAVMCGLPILYADSGGVSEMVNYGSVSVSDNNILGFEDEQPDLDYTELCKSYDYFVKNWKDLKASAVKHRKGSQFSKMLEGYFKVIKSLARGK